MSHPEPFYHLDFSLRSNIANHKNTIKTMKHMGLGLERNGFGFMCLVLFVEMLKYDNKG